MRDVYGLEEDGCASVVLVLDSCCLRPTASVATEVDLVLMLVMLLEDSAAAVVGAECLDDSLAMPTEVSWCRMDSETSMNLSREDGEMNRTHNSQLSGLLRPPAFYRWEDTIFAR